MTEVKRPYKLSYGSANDTWTVVCIESGERIKTFNNFWDAMSHIYFLEGLTASPQSERQGA